MNELKIKVNGTYKTIRNLYKRVNGSYQYVGEAEKKVVNAYKEFPMGFPRSVQGAAPLTIPDARAKKLMQYMIYGKSQRSITIDGKEYIIPDGYTLLESIKSDGNQYIDTGIIPQGDDDVSVDICNFQTYQTTGKNLFGLSYNGEWSPSKGWYVGLAASGDKTNWNFKSTLQDVTYSNLDISIGTKYRLSFNDDGFYVNDVRKITLGTKTTDTYTFNKSLYLFRANVSPSGYNDGSWSYGDTVIKINGAIVGIFIPAKRDSNNVLGMYNLVTNTFFTNAGTGTFTEGPELPLPSVPIGVVGCGDKTENLFDKDDPSILNSFMIHANTVSLENDNRGFSLKLTEGETYTVSKSNRGGLFVGASANPFVSGTNDHLPLLVQNSSTSAVTFTVPLGKPYIDIVYWHRTNDEGYTESDVRDTLMLVKGSSVPTSYIPYGYKLPVMVGSNCGCIDLGTVNWDYVGPTQSLPYGFFRVLVADKKPLLSTGMYLYGYSLGVGSDKHIWGDNDTSVVAITDSRFTDTATFKAAMSGKYLFYQRGTDTSWTTPTKQSIHISSPLNKVGTYADCIDYKNQRVVRNVGIKVLDGTESWNVTNTDYYLPIYDRVNGNTTLICSHFLRLKTYMTENVGFYIADMPSSVTDISSWKAYLAAQYAAGTPVIIYYPLATPTYESITVPDINPVKGTNYLDIETEVKPSNISATYLKRTN